MSERERPEPGAGAGDFSLLTSHARVLRAVALDPEARMRDVAAQLEITERAVQRIVADLEAAGYLTRERDGRRNRYSVNGGSPLRHPSEGSGSVARLLGLGNDGLGNDGAAADEITVRGPRRGPALSFLD